MPDSPPARKPFALSAYLAAARSRSSATPPTAARPGGALVWMHAHDKAVLRTLASIGARLRCQRPEISVLLTWPATLGPQRLPDGLLGQPLGPDGAGEAQGFAAHWRPQIGLWTGALLHPALLSRLHDKGTRLACIAPEMWRVPSPIWMPDCTTATLDLFDLLFAGDEPGWRRLRRLGLPVDRLRRSGPLIETAPTLDCRRTLHEEMAQLLSGRPCWLAARVRADEAGDILRAHARAIRLAHRLLLFMVPASREDGRAIATLLRESPLRGAYWDDGDMPDENTQVLLTEDASELGLWYRLAPVTFLGGSLRPGPGGEDPLQAAAHGTALLYGPNVGRYLSSYSRLAEAGAARIVRDSDTLATAVSHLVAPDHAAAMAHAGWDVVSQGAALTDEIIALVCDTVDAEPEPA
ncbi:3-deoxy-D-manno-octulosonic acid transferase [Citreicella sp. C3M06]|uniref:3-deoxy-D-manno-octulosonic acid transferase n=1 Tax=Citreicella sp. C3M06 TaxID=2841564 RepID=UPI001C090563|nr:glycosyltransferase N-terminal domain-containing protein [Citreicella sp. C3M06]MBU2962895.1 3-deoxy-D-manno-octulosonic acid transferase [Citreicella sp. C3M06]